MEDCNMKRGFFFLRPCDHPARQQCTMCGKSFCDEHLRIRPGKNEPACLDCLGKQMQRPANKDDDNDEIYEPTWSYGYRHTYYSGGNYSPWYMGRVPPDKNDFDGHDFRVFESDVEDSFDDNDQDGTGSTFDS